MIAFVSNGQRSVGGDGDMITRPSDRCARWRAFALGVLTFGTVMGYSRCSVAFDAIVQAEQFEIEEEDIISEVFQNHSTVASARKGAEFLMQTRTDAVDEACSLSPEQRKRLELAGHGDISRFFNDFESVRRTLPTGKLTWEEYIKVYQRIEPLHLEWSNGLHLRGSLFARSVRSTLDSRQLAAYDEFVRKRNRLDYAAAVKGVIAIVENDVPLTDEQRDRLFQLFLAQETPREAVLSSPFKVYAVLYRLAKIPTDQLRPIFLENEWEVISTIIRRAEELHQFFEKEEIEIE